MNNVDIDTSLKKETEGIKSQLAQINVLLDKILNHLQKEKK